MDVLFLFPTWYSGVAVHCFLAFSAANVNNGYIFDHDNFAVTKTYMLFELYNRISESIHRLHL